MRENRLLTFVIILIVLVVYAACRKTDMPKEKETKVDVKQIQHKFYYSHPAADPHIKALVGFLQRKNSSSDFIEKTIQRVGLPVWNKAQIYRNGNLAGRGQEDSVTYTYIPFSRENENFVNASLVIQTTPTDTTTSWICDWQYNYYDFNPPTGSSLTAIQVFIFFAKQDNHVFGRRQFSITDNRLLNCLAGMTVDTSKNYVIELDSVDGAARPESMGVPDPTCIVVMEYQQLHYTVTYHMIGDWCIIDEITWGNIPPPGNGGSGGSGGGGGTPPPPECEPPVANRGMNAQPPGTGCPPGWNVPPPIVPPTPSEDSLIALYLKYIYLQIEDSATFYYNKSDVDSMEWAFTLVRNNGLFVRKSRTDSLPDDVTPDLFLASSDTVIGFWHAHQGNTSWLNLNICFSVQDYWYIYQKLRRNNVVVYATTRDFVYALIITDATKFKNYLDGNNTRLVEPFLNNLYNQGEQSCGNCSASRLSEKANI